jgi:hypothetical protein
MKKYPVFVLSFNQFLYLKDIIKEIERLGGTPIIIDNNSKYPFLLKYLDELSEKYIVIRNSENYGPHVIYTQFNKIKEKYRSLTGESIPYPFFVTDPDLDLSLIPNDGLDKIYEAYLYDEANERKYIKYGFSIQYKDIPQTNKSLRDSFIHQRDLHSKPDKLGNIYGYNSLIDTTFHLYAWKRVGYPGIQFGPAFRLAEPYVMRHIPYYWTEVDLKENEEIRYYLSHLEHLNSLGYSKTRKPEI